MARSSLPEAESTFRNSPSPQPTSRQISRPGSASTRSAISALMGEIDAGGLDGIVVLPVIVDGIGIEIGVPDEIAVAALADPEPGIREGKRLLDAFDDDILQHRHAGAGQQRVEIGLQANRTTGHQNGLLGAPSATNQFRIISIFMVNNFE